MKGVQQAIRAGVDLEAGDEEGLTALHHAAARGRTNVARALIEAGARVDARDSCGRTPLILASAPEMISLLVDAGADVNARDEEENTAVHVAIEEDLPETLRTLLTCGADPDARFSGVSPHSTWRPNGWSRNSFRSSLRGAPVSICETTAGRPPSNDSDSMPG